VTPNEHYSEAERLLEQAASLTVITVPEHVTKVEAEEIAERFQKTTGARPVVAAGRVHVDASSVLLAALTHAVLAQGVGDR